MQLLEQTQSLDFPAPLPQTLLAVKQHFDAPRPADVMDATRRAFGENGLLDQITPGASVAVGVGSRGIANLALIVRTVIQQLRAAGAQPFVVPAMGSHGGGTAGGQRAVLAELGVTPESVGAEIRATAEVMQIGQIPEGPPLFQDEVSASADHTLLINRVKPHTDFHGRIESGLAKMAVIGLGGRRGATAMHAHGPAAFPRFLTSAAPIYAANTNLLGGLAILENAHDETTAIVGLIASEMGGTREEELRERARALMASLPFPEIDVLVVHRIGKNISGTGMDTNIIGRSMIPRQPEEPGGPDIAVIAVLDLTDESHGNAVGIGLANVTTTRVAKKIDWVSTYTNAVTSAIACMHRASLPITMADDRRAIQVAVRGCGQPYEAARIVLIRDTLTLDHLWVSPSLRPAVEAHPRLSALDEMPFTFSQDGTMTSPWQLT